MTEDKNRQDGDWDHSTHDQFFQYYANQSITPETLQRFRRQRDILLSLTPSGKTGLTVADIGCGAGTLALVWSELGHHVTGLDINEQLIELARERAKEAGIDAVFHLGSATDIPMDTASIDICSAPELLEHVVEWEKCLDEFARILRPGGVLYLSTTNKLCPRQSEFNLPFYSWYPGLLKRRYERLAVTTRPEVANYAKYPAVHWFSYYSLRAALAARGFNRFYDRFDLAAVLPNSGSKRAILSTIRALPPLRFAGQFAISASTIAAIKAD